MSMIIMFGDEKFPDFCARQHVMVHRRNKVSTRITPSDQYLPYFGGSELFSFAQELRNICAYQRTKWLPKLIWLFNKIKLTFICRITGVFVLIL